MSTQNKVFRVEDVMLPIGEFPAVAPTMYLKEALEEMERSRLGIICIMDKEGKLLGILTDGDIRRKLLHYQKPFSVFFIDDVIDHSIKNPHTTTADMSLSGAVDLMEEKKIWDLPVVDGDGRLVGLLHLHPAVQALLQHQ